MENRRLLVVDDERDLCEILQYNLETAGYDVAIAYSAEDALRMIEDSEGMFDLLLLDVMLDGMSGFDLAVELKGNLATAHLPIIFLTAKDTEEDLLEGFRLGADDYIAKPFSVREVLARVCAVLNRSADVAVSSPEVLSCEGLVLHLDSKTVSVDGEPVAFTRTEYELF